MTQGLSGKSNQNHNVATLLKEFQAEYGSYGGDNPGIQTLITYKVLKNMAAGLTGGSNTSSGGIASTVTIKGSTGQTILTDAEGRVVVANVANLLGRLPASLVEGRIPVGVVFPTNQQVTISNPTTGYATEQSLATLLSRIPSSTNNRLPVGVEFPNNQNVTVSNPITGFATEQTVSSLLARLTDIVEGRFSVDVDFPLVQHVLVDNPTTDHATEGTLTSLLTKLDTLPKSVNGKVPVSFELPPLNISNQIVGFSTEATLQALLDRNPTLANGKVPVVATLPSNVNVTVTNQLSDTAKESTLASILQRLPQLEQGKLPVAFTAQANISGFSTEDTLKALLNKTITPVDGKLPVSLAFPTNQQVTVSNPSDMSALAKDASLAAILAKLPSLVSGKTPVSLDFPQNQTVTVSNPTAAPDVSGLSKEATLAAVLAKLPSLVNGKTPVDFPANQTVTVSNPSDTSLLGKEATLTAILNRLPSDISKAIAQGFRSEFTTASPLATALTITPLGDSPLWTVARTKKVEGLDAFSQTFLGRRAGTFTNNGFCDIVEYDLQTVGSNLRSPSLNGTQTVEIVSSNLADNATGTGVRTVEVMYLDENFNLKTTNVTLNGLTAVQIQKDGIAIKPTCLMETQAISYGTGQGAAGTITIRIPAGGMITTAQPIDQITQGDTTSLSARCCVPEGYVGYVVEVNGAALVANHEFRLLATVAQSDKRLLDGVFNTIDVFPANVNANPVNRVVSNIELPSRCRVRLVSRASNNTAGASGGFTVVFVKKPV